MSQSTDCSKVLFIEYKYAVQEDSGENDDEDEERSGPLSRNSSMSDHSSVTDLPKRPKRGKRVINRLKGVFKA